MAHHLSPDGVRGSILESQAKRSSYISPNVATEIRPLLAGER
jgi:hypothetical protein